jgi:hypothetical protein
VTFFFLISLYFAHLRFWLRSYKNKANFTRRSALVLRVVSTSRLLFIEKFSGRARGCGGMEVYGKQIKHAILRAARGFGELL